jgi:LPXTG-motif cell wall-anchored protein
VKTDALAVANIPAVRTTGKTLIAATVFAAAAVFVSPGAALAKAPVTMDDSYNVVAGTTFTVAAPGVLANDTGVVPGAMAHWQTNPPPGFTLHGDGSITYVVPPGASGTASFTYCIVDLPNSPNAQCVSNLATVTVHIATPVVVDDTYDVVAGTTFAVAAPGVLANDTNVPTDPVVHWQTNPPAGFTLHDDGSIHYPVPASASGTATFTYCIVDLPHAPNARCVSNLATVTVRVVTSAPTPPPTLPPGATSPPPPISPPSGGGSALPQTGAPIGAFVVVGFVLIAAGVAILIIVRRRRAATEV